MQHPGVQDLMMTDIRNLQAFALCIQKTDIKFDLFSITKEMEKQVHTISSLPFLLLIIFIRYNVFSKKLCPMLVD